MQGHINFVTLDISTKHQSMYDSRNASSFNGCVRTLEVKKYLSEPLHYRVPLGSSQTHTACTKTPSSPTTHSVWGRKERGEVADFGEGILSIFFMHS